MDCQNSKQSSETEEWVSFELFELYDSYMATSIFFIISTNITTNKAFFIYIKRKLNAENSCLSYDQLIKIQKEDILHLALSTRYRRQLQAGQYSERITFGFRWTNLKIWKHFWTDFKQIGKHTRRHRNNLILSYIS